MAFEPIRISTKDVVDIETEPFFYIDEKEYRIPVKVPPVLSVRFLRYLRDGNTEQATAYAFDDLLGKGALDALSKCKGLTGPQLQGIMKHVEEKMLAAQEEMLGN